MRIVLASQSQFRKKALDILGLEYEIRPSHIDEDLIQDGDLMKRARLLAEAKARVLEDEPDALVVSGDLFCVFKGKIYEKPKDKADARRMLRLFSGKNLDVIASVAVYNTKTKKMLSKAEKCIIHLRELIDYEIDDYVKRYPVTKFAGGFDGDGASRLALNITGDFCFYNGIPMNALIKFLRINGVKV